MEFAVGYPLRFRFDNGDVRIVDIARVALFDGDFEPLSDPAFFAQARRT
jgi:hypothetical protein